MSFGVHSEVGKLRKVMVHRPGLEHTRLTPSNAEELLFDDVLWVEPGQGGARRVLRGRCASAGSRCSRPSRCSPRRSPSPTPRTGSATTSSTSARSASAPPTRAREWVDERRAGAGGGLPHRRHHQGRRRAGPRAGVGVEPTRPTMLLPPLPNFLFQRDPSCWIYDGVTLNPMTKPARKPETMIMEAIYRFHPMFARRGVPDLARRRRRGLGPLPRRGRRRAADRQRRGHDRHGRAHHPAGGAVDRPRRCSGPGSADAGAGRAPAEVAQLHAPRHGHHDVRPRPGHRCSRRSSTARGSGRSGPATPPTTSSSRSSTGSLPELMGNGPRRRRRCGSSRPAATRSRPSASSGTTATTSSPSSPASSSPTSATPAPTPRCARPASR